MIDTPHTIRKFPFNRLVPGITGTSAAFIDVSLVLAMTLLSVLAASIMQDPVETPMEITAADLGQDSSETPPLVSLEIFPDGVVIDRDGGRVSLDSLGSELADRAGGEGTVAVCVSAGVAYHEVRNVLADVQNVLGPRTWIDCGGAP